MADAPGPPSRSAAAGKGDAANHTTDLKPSEGGAGTRVDALREDTEVANTIHEVSEFAEMGPILSGAFVPRLSTREVVAWYSDIRGFTKYCNQLKRLSQERLIENFLRTYLKIYATALRLTSRRIATEVVGQIALEFKAFKPDHADPHELSHQIDGSARLREMLDRLAPAYFKNLGDGMLIVWELDEVSSPSNKSLLTRAIYQTIETTHMLFDYHFSDPWLKTREFYGDDVVHVRFASGVSRGQAFRLDFPGHALLDYAGPVMNLGARLCGLARPEGWVMQLDFSRSRFYTLAHAGTGHIATLHNIKGLEGETVAVFYEDAEIDGLVVKHIWSQDEIPFDK